MRFFSRLLLVLFLLVMLGGAVWVETRRMACLYRQRESKKLEALHAQSMKEWSEGKEKRADYFRLNFFRTYPVRTLATSVDWLCRLAEMPVAGGKWGKIHLIPSGSGLRFILEGIISAGEGRNADSIYKQIMKWMQDHPDVADIGGAGPQPIPGEKGGVSFRIEGMVELQ